MLCYILNYYILPLIYNVKRNIEIHGAIKQEYCTRKLHEYKAQYKGNIFAAKIITYKIYTSQNVSALDTSYCSRDMGCIWVVYGLCMGCVWVVYRLCMDCV